MKTLKDRKTVSSVAFDLVLKYSTETQYTGRDWTLMFGADKTVNDLDREEFLQAYDAAYEYFRTMI